MAYTPFGPWTNGSSPGISAAFLNGMETYLTSVNSAATDTHISSATGVLTTLGVRLATGSIARISVFTGFSSGTVAHGLGGTPSFVAVIGNNTTGATFGYNNPTSTTVGVLSSGAINWVALAIAF